MKHKLSQRSPKLFAPPNACDCHIHVYDRRFPIAPHFKEIPPDRKVTDYRKVQKKLRLSRVIVVQSNNYGTDNSCMLEALSMFGDTSRGVAVVDQTFTDDELRQLTAIGVRGVRFHMLKGGSLSWDVLEEIANRINVYGWHVQLQMDGRSFPEWQDLLKRLPGRLVIDHIGRFQGPVSVDHKAFKSLMCLIDTGRFYMKLAAPYHSWNSGPPTYPETGLLAKALIKAAPERMLWASNWPHYPYSAVNSMPDDGAMLDLLLEWVDNNSTINRILVDNPAELYGF